MNPLLDVIRAVSQAPPPALTAIVALAAIALAAFAIYAMSSVIKKNGRR